MKFWLQTNQKETLCQLHRFQFVFSYCNNLTDTFQQEGEK